jgi:hypothetical protein
MKRENPDGSEKEAPFKVYKARRPLKAIRKRDRYRPKLREPKQIVIRMRLEEFFDSFATNANPRSEESRAKWFPVLAIGNRPK